MLSYQNNDTLRESLCDSLRLRDSLNILDKFIFYGYPETIEYQKIFKDILDQGYGVCLPVITNTTALSDLYHHPILIEIYDEDGVFIGTYDGFRSLVKNIDILRDTISDYNNTSIGTLKMYYSEMKNRIKKRDKNAKLSK